MRLPALPSARLLDDLTEFAGHMISSWDLDPVYPVLHGLVAPLPFNQQVWHTYLYLAYYNVVSARRAFLLCPEPDELPGVCDEFPCATERRNLRGGKVREHVRGMLRATKGDPCRLFAGLDDEHGVLAGMQLTARVEAIPGNGRWASYKWGDLSRYVLGVPVEADGMGADGATGPCDGMGVLFGMPRTQARSKQMVQAWEDRAVNLADELTGRLGYRVQVDQIETLLCDFHSLVDGAYVVGHDIDLMLWNLLRIDRADELTQQAFDDVMAARHEALPHAYLGELHGWDRPDPARMRAYKERGVILHR